MLADITFRTGGVELASCATGAVPRIGETVALEIDLVLDGRHYYRVTNVTYQYGDTGARRVATVRPAPILVDLEEVP